MNTMFLSGLFVGAGAVMLAATLAMYGAMSALEDVSGQADGLRLYKEAAKAILRERRCGRA